MKYAIYDFSQAELVKFNDSHPSEKIDVIDLMIFRWFTHFAAIPKTSDGRTAMWRKVFDGEVYYWVNYQALIEEFPLFDIQTKKSISRRFDKYVSGGLMKKKVYKARNKGSLTFFAFTTEFSRFEYDENNAEQKINPHKAATQKICDDAPPTEADFREDVDVSSKLLEKTQTSALTQPQEVRKDVDVRSKPLERTQTSAPLKDTTTTSNSATTASTKKTEFSVSEAAEEELAATVTTELKSLFAGQLVFDAHFAPDIARLAARFKLAAGGIAAYLRYALRRTREKKPRSETSLFYTLAKSAAVMQDFLSTRAPPAPASPPPEPCPVCGGKQFSFGSCDCCGFDMARRADAAWVMRQRQIFALPADRRRALDAELRDVLLTNGDYSPTATAARNERAAAVYKKYGITA